MRIFKTIDVIGKNFSRREYDGFIGMVGYETRARFIAERVHTRSRRLLAIGYEDRQLISYKANSDWFREAGFSLVEPDEANFFSCVSEFLSGLHRNSDSSLHLCIDISSQTRFRIAACVKAVRSLVNDVKSVTVDFLYAAAKYSPPSRDASPNLEVGPLPGFSGWGKPDDLTTVVVGVGYEHNKALGAVRYLDPDEVWAFIPTGHDQRYTKQIERANEHLWDMVPPNQRMNYDVFHPLDQFLILESFTRGALRNGNLILLPFGPKIFALNCLLVSCLYPQIDVWRVSSGHQGEPKDCLPNKKITGLRVSFVLGEDSTNTL